MKLQAWQIVLWPKLTLGFKVLTWPFKIERQLSRTISRLHMMNICGKPFYNCMMNNKVTFSKSCFMINIDLRHLSLTLTFYLQRLVLHVNDKVQVSNKLFYYNRLSCIHHKEFKATWLPINYSHRKTISNNILGRVPMPKYYSLIKLYPAWSHM